MRRSTTLSAALLLSASHLVSGSHHNHNYQQYRREYVPVAQDAYDFVIAGGGLAGLVIASRLTEDANTTVLVIEAGETGDDVRSRIDIPSEAYFNGLLYTKYDWQYQTEPQPQLAGRNIPWPRGKGIGGSSAVNGMYMVRPSALEVDTWSQMQNGQDGATAWTWDSLFKAMKKSETFTPPSAEVQMAGNILYDESSHGTSGPLHYSYPGYILPIVGDWTETLSMIGVPISPDANGGSGWGAFIAASSINPNNFTRSYSRSAYIDPLPPRPNLHILSNNTVTKFFIENGRATAVEYAPDGYATRKVVSIRKELLLCGGAIGSPNILMQSGVGPRDVLERAGVPVVIELPGVGQHMQDHLSTQVVYKTNAETAATIHASGSLTLPNGTSSAVQSFINSAIAYANVTDLVGDWATTLHDQIMANLTAYAKDPIMNPGSADGRVSAGYEAIYRANADMLMTQIGQLELLFSLTGTVEGGPGSFAIQAALQHPFSQGRLYIRNNNAFDYPTIDPGYLTHPADLYLIREGLKLARKIGQTEPLSQSATEEVSPGPTVQTDADWDNWLRSRVGTEYHPSCTCAMLPLEQGGVVDPNLKVFGLSNVRVTDSSVYPIQFAAHLMAPTYGLAEQAADIIKAQYNGVPSPASLQTATANPDARTKTETTAAIKTGTAKSAATSTTTTSGALIGASYIAGSELLAMLAVFFGTLAVGGGMLL